MLPIPSCLHWMYRNCYLSSYLPDGGPGAAADVSNAVATSCRIACGNPWLLPVAVLGVEGGSFCTASCLPVSWKRMLLEEQVQTVSAQ